MARSRAHRVLHQRTLRPEALMAPVDNPGSIHEGECRPWLCGVEAACNPINGTHFTCICPHDSTPPTPDGRCPNRLTVPLTPRPIHNIIPPHGINTTVSTNTTLLQHFQTGTSETGILLAAFAASCLLLAILSALCCWKGRRLSRCCSFPHKLRKQQQNVIV